MTYDELAQRLTQSDCDNCGELIPSVSGCDPLQVDGGLYFELGGHYGGFLDNAFAPVWSLGTVLCHDCTAIMFDAVPNAFAKFANGKQHDCQGTPCVYGRKEEV